VTRVEICVESGRGVMAAQAAGADRVELCAALDLGGLTPSAGLVRLAADSGVACRALVRPRAGSFLYDDGEILVIEQDIDAASAFGLDGVVIGAAQADGRLDRERLARLVERCGAMGRTLHRVFDLTPDPFEALELAVELGFDRILTSGQAVTALAGAPLLARLLSAARGRISLVAAAGVGPATVGALLDAAPLAEVHASCRAAAAPDDAPRLAGFGFGATPPPTDVQAVEALVRIVRSRSP
jgi:copper homeostasis protein